MVQGVAGSSPVTHPSAEAVPTEQLGRTKAPGRHDVGPGPSRFIHPLGPSFPQREDNRFAFSGTRSVHLSSCREHPPTRTTATTGSSPLAGTRADLRVDLRVRGIIPAHAGSTGGRRPAGRPSAGHPRSRGEHLVDEAHRRRPPGSSPLARGAHDDDASEGHADRIIPARAGSTVRGAGSYWTTTDHPCSRGEHARSASRASRAFGSSPLARGARDNVKGVGSSIGIIPARAGSTCAEGLATTGTPDHPRSRGEHISSYSVTRAGSGSSPLARGALDAAASDRRLPRIIPARAGSTSPWVRGTCVDPDHPRSRGEHSFHAFNSTP